MFKRLNILIYHRVIDAPDPVLGNEVDCARFDTQLRYLKSLFNVLPLDQALQGLRDGNLPARAVCITFDDGYADNVTNALPILQRHGLSATFFISTGFLDGGRMWNDSIIEYVRQQPPGQLRLGDYHLPDYSISDDISRHQVAFDILKRIKHLPVTERTEQVAAITAAAASLPNDLMMSSAQLKTLSDAGMEIGAHTLTHPILARTDEEQARHEIVRSRAELQSLLNRPIRFFAYPNGRRDQDYNDAHVAMAREEGFDAALSTNPGVCSRNSDWYQLPRFSPWDRHIGKYLLRLAGNYRNPA